MTVSWEQFCRAIGQEALIENPPYLEPKDRKDRDFIVRPRSPRADHGVRIRIWVVGGDGKVSRLGKLHRISSYLRHWRNWPPSGGGFLLAGHPQRVNDGQQNGSEVAKYLADFLRLVRFRPTVRSAVACYRMRSQ